LTELTGRIHAFEVAFGFCGDWLLRLNPRIYATSVGGRFSNDVVRLLGDDNKLHEETDIRQKDEKSSKNRQNRARNGKAWKRQSQIEAKVNKSQSQPRQSQSQEVIKSKKIQL
ncbi:hypothetical protein Tco_0701494, partial [Tanacetum coccineum]